MRGPLGDSWEYEVSFATLKSIGIIDYLQSQLRSKEIIVDDEETLLNYYPLTDTADLSDAFATPTTSSPPYKWANDLGTTPNRWCGENSRGPKCVVYNQLMSDARLQQILGDSVLEVTETLPIKKRYSEKRLLEQKAYFESLIAKGQEGLARVTELLTHIQNEKTQSHMITSG